MKQIEPCQVAAQTFKRIFRKHVHLLVAMGYEATRESLHPGLGEEKITDCLAHAIDDITQSPRRGWWNRYVVFNEKPISGGEHMGNERRDIDMVIRSITRTGYPEYVFEAKPLNYHKKHERTGNYTNEKGMMRFFTPGDYAWYTARYPEMGMLGYVLSDTPEIWKARLQKAIAKNQTKLKLEQPQSDILFIDAFPHEWISTHTRPGIAKLPISFYHILLDFVRGQAEAK